MQILHFSFLYLNLSVRKIDNFFILDHHQCVTGYFSYAYHADGHQRISISEKAVTNTNHFFYFINIVFAVIYACADVGFEKIFHLRDKGGPKISLLNEITRNSINNFFLLFIWNLIYYIFHYVERNRRQEVDTLKLQSLVKELELKTIKSHINPHFIFNALNSIRALVDENPERARTAITELSNILRSSMQAEKLETVPLERELDIVKDYLALEQMRFEERLKDRNGY